MTTSRHPLEPAVRLAVVLCLGVDAWVHLRVAPDMQVAAPGGLGGGTLFRVQAAAAVLAAVLLLVTGSRVPYAVAEGLGVVLAGVGLALTSRRPGEGRATSQGAGSRVAGP